MTSAALSQRPDVHSAFSEYDIGGQAVKLKFPAGAKPPTDYGIAYTTALVAHMRNDPFERPLVHITSTGSGIEACAIAAHFSHAKIRSNDLCKHAVQATRENLRINKHSIERNHHSVVTQNDGFFGDILKPENLDIVCFNPPQRISFTEQELHGGKGGVALLRAYLAECKRVLRPGARVYFPTNSMSDEASVLADTQTYGSLKRLAKHNWHVDFVNTHRPQYQGARDMGRLDFTSAHRDSHVSEMRVWCLTL